MADFGTQILCLCAGGDGRLEEGEHGPQADGRRAREPHKPFVIGLGRISSHLSIRFRAERFSCIELKRGYLVTGISNSDLSNISSEY